MNKLMGAKFKTLLYAIMITFIGFAIIISPNDSVSAALNGVKMWGEVVFPSLFPFFVISEIMIGIGIVNFVGIILEPFMRPLFRVTGAGGFVVAMGMASGFPAGAKFTARLRQEKQITAIEAERLSAFTNSASPLFMSGAIAVGFFHNAALSLLIMVCHYLGNLFVGITMRFYGKTEENSKTKRQHHTASLKLAFEQMHQKRLNDNQTLGRLLGDSVNSAIQTLLMVGGFIILFSVLNNVLSIINVTDAIGTMIGIFFSIFTIPAELSPAFFSGLLEITNGAQQVSETADVSLFYQVLLVSFILGFNGFSIQAQAATFLAQADIRFWPFFIGRILHGIYAMGFTAILWKPLYAAYHDSNPPVISWMSQQQSINMFINLWEIFVKYGSFITLFSIFFFIIYQLKIMK